jgi:hypothetical protein
VYPRGTEQWTAVLSVETNVPSNQPVPLEGQLFAWGVPAAQGASGDYLRQSVSRLGYVQYSNVFSGVYGGLYSDSNNINGGRSLQAAGWTPPEPAPPTTFQSRPRSTSESPSTERTTRSASRDSKM